MTSRSQERRQDAEGNRSKPALPVREILAGAARAGQRSPWRIIAVAIVVSMVTALVDIAVTHLIDRTNLPLSVFGDLTSTAVGYLGAVFLSGFLCRIVSAAEHGGGGASLGHVVRTLPWARLVLADLLVVVLVVAGLLALVIPGLAAVSFFAVVGPVIEIENRPVRMALRRSAHLVRPYFWWVTLLTTVPLAVSSELESLAPEAGGVGEILEELAIRGIGVALLESAIGLVLVELCYRLIALDRKPTALKKV
jgi:hypothetical protein